MGQGESFATQRSIEKRGRTQEGADQQRYDSIPVRFICANDHPDHDTIASFRSRFLPFISGYFGQILTVAQTMGLLALGTVSLDGSKMKANASKHKVLSYGHACQLEARIKDEVRALLALAEEADRQSDAGDIDIPEELVRREERLAAILVAKAKLEARAEERYQAERAAHEENQRARKAAEKARGNRRGGKPAKRPERGPRATDQVNLTDEESRVMPTRSGAFDQAYNVQAAVGIKARL